MKLLIEKAVYGGLGLSRVEGKTFFVPLTLPGEEVEAHIVEEKRSFTNAGLDAVLTPSPFRVEPQCPYFSRCGGCHYQQAGYGGQLKIKQAVLEEAFARAGVREIPPIEVISAEPWRYRNRIRLLVKAGNRAPLAYRGWKSHEAVAVEACPIAASVLERAIQVLTEAAAKIELQEWAREIEFFCNADESALLLSVTTKRMIREEELQSVYEVLKQLLPELRGISAFAMAEEKDEELRGPLLAQVGDAFLEYRAEGQSYRVSSGSFFQVNRFLVDRLVELVTKGRSGNLAWDLYAGVGLFASVLAHSFTRVVAVESAPVSSMDLAYNLPASHRHMRMGTLEFLRQNRKAGQKPELIVVDPPRAGLGKEVTQLLSEVASRQLVYVSCDPSTLGRDLNALLQTGYHLRKLSMVDLFPQTFHIESVAELQR